jgi:hypothetical protein
MGIVYIEVTYGALRGILACVGDVVGGEFDRARVEGCEEGLAESEFGHVG